MNAFGVEHPDLSPEELSDLAVRAQQGDRHARELLILGSLPYVESAIRSRWLRAQTSSLLGAVTVEIGKVLSLYHKNKGGWVPFLICKIVWMTSHWKKKEWESRHGLHDLRSGRPGWSEPTEPTSEIREQIAQALSLLSEQERDVIERKYFRFETQRRISAARGVSCERIRQVESRALNKLAVLMRNLA